ncbi:MAG: GlsB/YeaQ/YmgE family stress response membrane protein [Candidatus Eremiobacteraeota bacterium]|nr:GlsB/YeaQ/YmgE family stress response membrane protein [Candidatus Eremiobacteraeota bacterium]
MGILAWILFGLIVGLVARWVVPGEGPGGIIGDIIVGVLGAFVGGWLYSLFGHTGVTGFNLPRMLCALIGAVVLLWIIRAVRGRPATY